MQCAFFSDIVRRTRAAVLQHFESTPGGREGKKRYLQMPEDKCTLRETFSFELARLVNHLKIHLKF